MKRLVAGVLAVLLAAAGCARSIDGTAHVGSAAPDPAFFFAGEVPVYGQTVSANDKTALAYLRALRRIDVCGLLDRELLAKIGEIGSVGTLFAHDECDYDIKVPGENSRRFASVGVTLSRVTDISFAFVVGQVRVYESYPNSCDYLLPLDLTDLPGAQPLRKPDQPYLRIGVIGEENCDFTQRLVQAVAAHIAPSQLPARDAVAVYPSALAERDPCEVLSVIGADVDRWDIGNSRPYECDFDLWRAGLDDVVSMQVSLEPQIVDVVSDDHERMERDGVEVFVDRMFCSAVAFLSGPMQRRILGGDFVDTGELVVRPAVVVEGGSGQHGDEKCSVATDVATAAAKLYR